MSNVRPFIIPQAAMRAIERAGVQGDNPERKPPGGGGNGEPPLEARVSKLEGIAEKTNASLAALDRDLAILKVEVTSFKQEAVRTFATKADVAEAKYTIIVWIVSSVFLAQLLPFLLKKFGL